MYTSVTDRMDIRIDTGFHHRNPNVYIPPSYVNNPNNEYTPKYMPLTIFNLSRVDHLYVGKDTIIAFADQSEFDTYNVEIARYRIKTSLAMFARGLKSYVMNMDRHSQNIMRTLAEQSLSKWM